PRYLKAIHPRRFTPHLAILTLMAIVLVLGVTVDITPLAKATSVLLMAVFVVINGALVVLKHRPGEPKGTFEVPLAVPMGGIVISGLLLAHAKLPELKLALILLVGIALLYFIIRPKAVTEDTFIVEG
ncbi:MAG: amino acid transporter, partial [Armatimonadetes bacterium]|nr:amino acid transporter [Armatimonadota bacterium]